MPQQTVQGICGICDAACSVDVEVEDGALQQVKPRNGHPFGSCCIRGSHAPEVVYSPDRILHPLKWVGPKGNPCFERCSWDEALLCDVVKA